jgi:hypothetical protein
VLDAKLAKQLLVVTTRIIELRRGRNNANAG